MKYIIIGFGGRGCMYSWYFKNCGAELVGVCDTNPERLELAKTSHGLSAEQLYSAADDILSGEKKGELCVVSTQDSSHHRIAVQALSRGYDLLLEKPIAGKLSECEEIASLADKLQRRVFVCHVLRYAPFFRKLKEELETGKYGRISTINQTENVGYWHQAHSYVRGNWRREETSTPMILAKCCHDLDIISWLIGEDCEYVSSMGNLRFFTRENRPKEAADRCTDCSLRDICAYSAVRFYLGKYDAGEKGWPCDVLALHPTRESLTEALRTGPYGRCVFACDNDVVDHQVVNMQFRGGATAHLTMTAFSADSYREIHVHAEYGDIYGNMEENILHCNLFGAGSRTINIGDYVESDKMAGHGDGDGRLIRDIVNVYENKPSFGLTEIGKSVQSHKIAFAAEESRKKQGEVVRV